MPGIAAELDPDGAWRRDFEQRAAASRGRPGPGPAPAGSYLARKFGDHADVRLLPSAAEELTPAFVAGLNRVAGHRLFPADPTPVLHAVPQQRGPLSRVLHSFSRTSLLDDLGPTGRLSRQASAAAKNGRRK